MQEIGHAGEAVRDETEDKEATAAELVGQMTKGELRGDARDEERRHDEADDARRAVTMLKEEREERQTEGCAHPLKTHNDGETAQSLLCTALCHRSTLLAAHVTIS